jgi:hypothetical protein
MLVADALQNAWKTRCGQETAIKGSTEQREARRHPSRGGSFRQSERATRDEAPGIDGAKRISGGMAR